MSILQGVAGFGVAPAQRLSRKARLRNPLVADLGNFYPTKEQELELLS